MLTILLVYCVLTLPVVRRIRGPLLNEFLTTMHTIRRLRGVRHPSKEGRSDLVSGIRHERRQRMVTDQFSTCQRDLHRIQEPGERILQFAPFSALMCCSNI